MRKDIQRINQLAENVLQAPLHELRKVPLGMRNQLLQKLEASSVTTKNKKTNESRIEQIMRETDYLADRAKAVPAHYYDNYERPDTTAKIAFYNDAIRKTSTAQKLDAYKTLGAIPPQDPSLGKGDNLLPQNMSQELLVEPIEENALRNVEPVSQIRGLTERVLTFEIDDLALEDITDEDTANEIELEGDVVEYGRFKTKIVATITDTVIHGSGLNLAATIENALRSGVAKKEKIVAFRTEPTDTPEIDRQSFYLVGIKEIEGSDTIDAIIQAWADLPEAYSTNASVVMKKSDYYAAIRKLANNADTLWGKKPEDVIGIPVHFSDAAVIPVVGDFNYSRQNYDIAAIFDTDKDATKGLYYFVLTTWSDHRIRLKSAFRLATVAE